jgi:RND family efflux transporter MFP subunit
VWVWIDLFERDLPSVHVGDDVAVRTDSVPGRTFVGKIGYIRDQVNRDTRAVRARIDVDNKDHKLKPGMYASVRIADPHASDGHAAAALGLAVPTPAVIREGDATWVFVEERPGRYERRAVRVGRRSASRTEVLDGITAGERVVTDGTFYLKSEARRESLAEGGHSH